jgi:hypothetical protein
VPCKQRDNDQRANRPEPDQIGPHKSKDRYHSQCPISAAATTMGIQ